VRVNLPRFSWLSLDPALIVDRIIALRASVEAEEKRLREQERKRKARKIRQLTRMAKAGAFKDKPYAR
jgi:hypothetical protein